MSEYQYYEFRAVDRALTDRQMRELRAISTRAEISRTSFSNYYTFGDLKANPRDLLVKYFDASPVLRQLAIPGSRVPIPDELRGREGAPPLRRGPTLEVRSTARDVIVTISVESEGQSFDAADDGSSWLSSLIGLRTDLASGDERILYLGWLLNVQSGEIDNGAIEPARPEGLGNLAPALDSFIDIVGIDRNLVAAAAEGAPVAERRPSARNVERLLAGLDTREHLTLLARVARGDGGVGTELMRRSRQNTRGRTPALPLRTAHELRARAEAIAERRRKAAGRREVQLSAARERQEEAARDQYLTDLAKREHQAWRRVETFISTKRPRDYTAAVELLTDLRDVSGRKGRGISFAQHIRALRLAHAKKPSLLLRLRKAGL